LLLPILGGGGGGGGKGRENPTFAESNGEHRIMLGFEGGLRKWIIMYERLSEAAIDHECMNMNMATCPKR